MPSKPLAASTVAVLIGVESYAAGTQMDLDGPAKDVINVAEYLDSQGVPASNIFTFVNSLAANEEADKAALKAIGLIAKEPTENNIYEFLTTELTSRPEENFFFYWSGHGLADVGQAQLLETSDSVGTNRKHINLEKLRLALATRNYQGLSNQFFIVDCCANILHRPVNALPYHDFPNGIPCPNEVNQSIIYAAAVGQSAHIVVGRRAGILTEEILPMMKAKSWPPAFDEIAPQLTARFGQLRSVGQASQTPTSFFLNGQEGIKSFADISPAPLIEPVVTPIIHTLVELAPEGKQRIVKAALQVVSLQEADSRRLIIRQLRRPIKISISHHPTDYFDLLALIDACLEFDYGLQELLTIVSASDGDKVAFKNLLTVVAELLPEEVPAPIQ